METPQDQIHRDVRVKIAGLLAWAEGADPIRAEIERHCENVRQANDAVDTPGFLEAILERSEAPPSGYEVELAAIFYKAGYLAAKAESDPPPAPTAP